MPRVFIGNFDFEHRLAYPGSTPPSKLTAFNAVTSPVWSLVAEPGDAIWTPLALDPEIRERLTRFELPDIDFVSHPPGGFDPVVWGVDDQSFRVAGLADRGLAPDFVDVVRRVNSRVFKLSVERDLGIALDPTEACATVEQLRSFHSRGDFRDWVWKGEYGGAGRSIRFVIGTPSEDDFRWAANRFRSGQSVVVEPFLNRVEEAGLQYEIGSAGEVAWHGIAELVSDHRGAYAASRPFEAFESGAWGEAVATGLRVARRVASEGYAGPLGIDVMRYRTSSGDVRLRFLQDLNCRWTMGRIALGLSRFPDLRSRSGGVFRLSDFAAKLAD